MCLLFTLKCLLILNFARAYICKNSIFESTVITVTDTKNITESVRLNKCPMSTIILSENTREIKCTNQNISDLFALSISYLHYLVRINLNNNQIKYIRPNAFYELSSLSWIDLSVNNIEEIWNGCFGTVESLKHLILAKNLIKKIDENAFVDMKNLSTVDISINELSVWSVRWFSNSPKLSYINMMGNKIKYLPRDAFINNVNLSIINFAHNELTSIHSDTFNGLNYLYELRLDNNRIVSFREDTFSKTITKLTKLYVNNNNLTYLPMKMLEDLEKMVVYINLHSNPFQCACYTDILRWLNNNRRDKRKIYIDAFKTTCLRISNPVCVTSYKNPDKCIEEIDDEVQIIYWKNVKPLPVFNWDKDLDC